MLGKRVCYVLKFAQYIGIVTWNSLKRRLTCPRSKETAWYFRHGLSFILFFYAKTREKIWVEILAESGRFRTPVVPTAFRSYVPGGDWVRRLNGLPGAPIKM